MQRTKTKSTNTNYPLLAATLAAFATANLQAAPFTYRLVASLGQTAPGGAQYIDYFEVGQINDWGDVIFGAEVGSNGGATDLGEGTFLTHFGRLAALELPGSPAPGGGGTFFELLSPTTLNDLGEGATAVALT